MQIKRLWKLTALIILSMSILACEDSSDPEHLQQQLLSYRNAADEQIKNGDIRQAVESSRSALLTIHKLLETDKDNLDYQKSLLRISNDMAYLDAVKSNYMSAGERLARAIETLKLDPDNVLRSEERLQFFIHNSWIYLNWSWYQLLSDGQELVTDVLPQMIALLPEDDEQRIVLSTNLAHAYLLSGYYAQAKSMYEKHSGHLLSKKNQTWDEAIIADIDALQDKGVSHPDFRLIHLDSNGRLRLESKSRQVNAKQLVKSNTQNRALFDAFQYTLKSANGFVLSGDKKRLYINDVFSRHQIKAFDVDSEKLVAMSETDGDYAYGMAGWNDYLIARVKAPAKNYAELEKNIYRVALYDSKDGLLTKMREKQLSDKGIERIIVKDSKLFYAIDEAGTVFELDAQLEVKNHYQLKDMMVNGALYYDANKQRFYYATNANKISTFDLATNQVIATSKILVHRSTKGQYAKIETFSLDRTGSKLIGGFDSAVGIYDLNTQELHRFGSNRSQATIVSVSPDFKTIVSAGITGDLKVWDYETLTLKREIQLPSSGFWLLFSNAVNSVHFIDSEHFIYSSASQGARMLSVSDDRVVHRYNSQEQYVHSIKASDNELLLISGNATILTFNLQKGVVTHIDRLPLDNINRVVSNRNGRLLLCASDGAYLLFDIKARTYQEITSNSISSFTHEIALHPTQNRYAKLDIEGALQIYNIDLRQNSFNLESKDFDETEILAFMDKHVLLYGRDYEIPNPTDVASENTASEILKPYLQLIDTQTSEIAPLLGHLDKVNAFDISKDKRYLLTASSDRTIKLWKLNLGDFSKTQLLDTAYGEESEVYGVKLSDNQTQVVSLGKNGSIVLRDIDLQAGKFGKAVAIKGQISNNKEQKRRTFVEMANAWRCQPQAFFEPLFFDNDTKLMLKDAYQNLNVLDTKTGDILYRVILLAGTDWIKLYPDGSYVSSKEIIE